MITSFRVRLSVLAAFLLAVGALLPAGARVSAAPLNQVITEYEITFGDVPNAGYVQWDSYSNEGFEGFYGQVDQDFNWVADLWESDEALLAYVQITLPSTCDTVTGLSFEYYNYSSQSMHYEIRGWDQTVQLVSGNTPNLGWERIGSAFTYTGDVLLFTAVHYNMQGALLLRDVRFTCEGVATPSPTPTATDVPTATPTPTETPAASPTATEMATSVPVVAAMRNPADHGGNGSQPFLAWFYVEVFVAFVTVYMLVRLFDQTQFTLLWTALAVAAAWVGESWLGFGIVFVCWLVSLIVMGWIRGLVGMFGKSY